MKPESQRKKAEQPKRPRFRTAWVWALLFSLMVHGGLMLWALLREPPEQVRASTAVTRADDRPIAVSLFDPAQGRSDGSEDGSLSGDAPAQGKGEREEKPPRAEQETPESRRPPARDRRIEDQGKMEDQRQIEEQKQSAEAPAPSISDAQDSDAEDSADGAGSPDIQGEPEGMAADWDIQPWGFELDLDELDTPPELPDDGSESQSPPSVRDGPTLPPDTGLPVPDYPRQGSGSQNDPLAQWRRQGAGSPDSSGSGSQGTGGTGDPGSARLFDPEALDRSVSRWRQRQPSTDELIDAYGTDDGDSLAAEHDRVSARIGQDVSDAQIRGDVRGGLLSSCNDGIDNNYDGWIDCGDPGCREVLPFCRGTVVHTRLERREIPDNHPGGISSEIQVGKLGSVRALSVKIRLRHSSPGDLAVVLEHVESQKIVVLKKTKRSERHFVSAFYTRDFNGGPVSGRWRLTIRDLVEGGVGTLEEWHLVITG